MEGIRGRELCTPDRLRFSCTQTTGSGEFHFRSQKEGRENSGACADAHGWPDLSRAPFSFESMSHFESVLN